MTQSRLAYQIAAVETARRIVTGAASAPRGAEREALAEMLGGALRSLRWLGAHQAKIGLSFPREKISLAERMRCVDLAQRVVAGLEPAAMRAAERDYLGQALEAAERLLRWAREHEYEIRTAVPRETRAAPAEPRKGCAFPLARRAAMRCGEAAFRKFLRAEDEGAAAEAVRLRCGVASRKDLDASAEAGARWRALDASYAAWLSCADVELSEGVGS